MSNNVNLIQVFSLSRQKDETNISANNEHFRWRPVSYGLLGTFLQAVGHVPAGHVNRLCPQVRLGWNNTGGGCDLDIATSKFLLANFKFQITFANWCMALGYYLTDVNRPPNQILCLLTPAGLQFLNQFHRVPLHSLPTYVQNVSECGRGIP